MDKVNQNIISKNKALFLDRDGVINIDYGYVYEINKFHLIENIQILIKKANIKDYKVIIITNQAGIGRQLYSENEFYNLTNHMKLLFLENGCHIDAIYHCPYHPKDGIGKYLKDSNDRKPNPGMLLKAKKDFDLDMKKSILIGDKITDIEAGNNALVGTNILFNKNNNNNKKLFNVVEITSLIEATKYL